MSNYINKLIHGDLESFRNDILNTLYTKAGESLDIRKVEIANNIYSNQKQESEPENNETEVNEE